MSRSVGVLVVHGIGSQGPDFADPFVRRVMRRLGERGDSVVLERVHWAPVLVGRGRRLWQDMHTAARLDWAPFRRFAIDNFADALAYRHVSGRPHDTYERIHGVFHDAVEKLERRLREREAAQAPLVIVSHSLGCHIASNYIWDRQHWLGSEPDPLAESPFARMETLLGMITLGCNMPLFTLAYDRVVPILLPGRSVSSEDARRSRWINWFDRDDVLGWPLRPVYEPCLEDLSIDAVATVERIEDRPVRARGLFGGTPLSHLGYWTNRTVIRSTAEYLSALVECRASGPYLRLR